MIPLVLAVFIAFNDATVGIVKGEGCSSTSGNKGPVISMCEARSWTLGDVYISVTSATMGTSTRCSCTVSATAQGQNITTNFILMEKDATGQDCQQAVMTIQWPGAAQRLDCVSQLYNVPTIDSTGDVGITLSRPSLLVSTGLCLYVFPKNRADGNLNLTCQSDEPPASTPATSPTSETTMLTSSFTSSLISSTNSATPTTAVSETTTLTPSFTSSLISSTNSATPTTAVTTTSVAMMSSNERSMATESGLDKDKENGLIAPIAGGVAGGVVLILIIAIIVVIYTRKKRQSEPPREEGPAFVNRGYENVLTDNILYESSSGLANNQSPPSSQPMMTNSEGAYQSIDENGKSPSVTYYNTSGGVASVSTRNEKENPIFGATNDYATMDETTPRKSGAEPKMTSAPPPATSSAPAPASASAAAPAAAPAAEPPSDQYAVVNKPLRQKNPTQNAAAKSKSANVTLPSGDVYAVVDRSTNRGSEPGPAHSPPPEVSPPPAPAPSTTPGLVYADLDLVTTPRSSAGIPAPPTDDAEIDHEASARL